MILRKGDVPVTHPPAALVERLGAISQRWLSDAGGLTQFGALLETLEPGSRSSERHWHEAEDEFLYVLDGVATVIEDDGEHVIGPGDAAAWPAGAPNAHHVINRTSAPVTYLLVGTRATRDAVHLPDAGRTEYKDGPDWRVVDRDGNVLAEGRDD
jgi:uncharacterized cupin superfamily protein